MTNYVCGSCGSTEQFSCNCWEKEGEGARCSPRRIAGQIYLEELRDSTR